MSSKQEWVKDPIICKLKIDDIEIDVEIDKRVSLAIKNQIKSGKKFQYKDKNGSLTSSLQYSLHQDHLIPTYAQMRFAYVISQYSGNPIPDSVLLSLQQWEDYVEKNRTSLPPIVT